MSQKHHHEIEEASCFLGIGSIYLRRANYPVALENYKKSLQISETVGDTLGISKALNNLGLIYKNNEQSDNNHTIAKGNTISEERAKQSTKKI